LVGDKEVENRLYISNYFNSTTLSNTMVRRNAKKSKASQGKKATRARNSVRRTAGSRLSTPSNPSFGAVSTINTAPVAIGNSMRGFEAQVVHTAEGCRVIGRDFAFTPVATGTVTGWSLVGGMPLTPACMPSTALRNLCQMYNKFKFNTCLFHYITSSSTTTTGDVVFQYNKNPESSVPNWTGNSFLPYVLSDSLTVIGPQWTNHTLTVKPTGPWSSTDYGMTAEPRQYSQGDIYLYSKTSSTESPGYVIFDYDITFKELSVNPRAGLLPTIKAQWTPVSFGTFGNYTLNSSIVIGTSSTSYIGGTSITAPTLSAGEVYKFVIDSTNSAYSATTAANFFTYQASSGATAATTVALADGYTIYFSVNATGTVYFYANIEQAVVSEGPSTALAAGVTANFASEILRGTCKLIASCNPAFHQVQY